MSLFSNLNDIKEFKVIPGYNAKFIHTSNMTFAHWSILAGAVLPEHSHFNEQVANVLEGEFELTVNGQTQVLKPGSIAVIPSNAIHSGRAITDCKILDTFSPTRDDYRERFRQEE